MRTRGARVIETGESMYIIRANDSSNSTITNIKAKLLELNWNNFVFVAFCCCWSSSPFQIDERRVSWIVENTYSNQIKLLEWSRTSFKLNVQNYIILMDDIRVQSAMRLYRTIACRRKCAFNYASIVFHSLYSNAETEKNNSNWRFNVTRLSLAE